MIVVNSLIIANWTVFGALGILLVARIWVNLRFGRRRILPEDYFLIAACCLSFLSEGLNTITWDLVEAVAQRAGQSKFETHSLTLMAEVEIVRFLKVTNVVQIIYLALVWLIKAAFCTIYLEISKKMSTNFRKTVYVMIAFTATTFVAVVLATLLTCRPFSRTWISPLFPKHCSIFRLSTSATTFTLSNAADIGLIFHLILLIHHLRVHSIQLYALLLVLLVGSVSIIAGTVRFVMAKRLFESGPSDYLENFKKVSIWSNVEYQFGFIAACMPTFRVILNGERLQKIYKTRDHTSNNKTEGAHAQDPENLVPGEATLAVAREEPTRAGGNRYSVQRYYSPVELRRAQRQED